MAKPRGRGSTSPGHSADRGRLCADLCPVSDLQSPAQGGLWGPPLPRRAAATSVWGMTEPPSPGVECVPLGLPGALCPSPSRSACTSPSSPPVTGPECAARTGERPPPLRDHLQDRLPPKPWTNARQASLRLLPRLEADRQAPCGLRSRSPTPTAICQPPCQNGGSCVQPGRCHCPAGWRGDTCQTDVDGHSAGGGGCSHHCASTPGGGWCQCPEAHGPSDSGKLSPPRRGTPGVAPSPDKGVDSVVEEEVQRLRSRVDILEQKLQLVLAPLHSLASRALAQGLPDPGSLLAHSLRQLDRIDSLSEQISFLEEQLGSCSCKKEL
ncbi:epidermal growth factor-like protein 7 isoform X3 [Sturnira hondurensis]|uniref:epidermal growth factor-like protein 7 isoform X3 n=2 Tax=Sturnira hondurensis TaxID=192404 RepID=UPI0018797373|nr:epidermal growth factor-like protein 7 isoform X3 [Sturnira hondurensis]